MSEHLLIGLSAVLFIGIAAQWLAWRLHLPSILLLLICGFVAGPVLGWLDVQELMGDLLFPVVSISVALILFEGGLSLRFQEVREVRRAVRNLILVGALITWVTSSVAAYFLLDFDFLLSLLLGAILIVTGPTVVVPLLRHVRPAPRVGSIAKWEGIIIDPVGATAAVLVFEAIFISGIGQATGNTLLGFIITLLAGVLIGGGGAMVVVIFLRFHWVPDYLQNPVTLTTVVSIFAVSNHLQAESGLLAVTIMGVALANQKTVAVKHIIEFKENLRVLLISSLFILLAARLEVSQLESIDLRAGVFVLILIGLARPLSVFLSTLGTGLQTREKLFLSWMAPRGIVAAAVTSIFSLRLVEAGYQDAERLVPLVFLVIVATVALYGLTAKPVARWLDLAQEHPQGFLFVGAHSWSRSLAQLMQQEGFQVMLADTNWENIRKCRMAGLPSYYGSVLSEYALDELELDGIGRLLAMTPNDEANALACLHFVDVFGRAEVFQTVPHQDPLRDEERAASHLWGRLLFDSQSTFEALNRRFLQGGIVKATRLSESFTLEDFVRENGDAATVLFAYDESRQVRVATADRSLTPRAGDTLVSLVDEEVPRRRSSDSMLELTRKSRLSSQTAGEPGPD